MDDDLIRELEELKSNVRDLSAWKRNVERQAMLSRLGAGASPRLVALGMPTEPMQGGGPSGAGTDTLGNVVPLFGQTNVLLDPTFESIGRDVAVTVGTSLTAAGQWACHYVLNSGTAPSPRTLTLSESRGAPYRNPFSSGLARFDLTFALNTAADIDFYLYPEEDAAVAFAPTLDFLIGAVRVFQQTQDLTTLTSIDIRMQLLEDGSVVAESADYDYKAATDGDHRQLFTFWQDTQAEFRAHAWRWRLKVHIVRPSTGAAMGMVVNIGEPQLHWSYTPDPVLFSPQISQWFPTDHPYTFALSGRISPASLTANTDDWAPTSLPVSSMIHVQCSAGVVLSGIVGGWKGRVLVLANVGSNALVLKHDATSAVGNRFLCPGSVDFTLGVNSAVMIYYSTVSWRLVAA